MRAQTIPNNFDLIRLVAAFQVVVHHASAFLAGVYMPLYFTAFPGVPIFFFTSGFLISRSWEKNPSLTDYAVNRCLRIFPGLWVCFFLSVVSAFVFSAEPIQISVGDFLVWTFAQLTAFQLYYPGFMASYGMGVLNGALWTIPVELQFYLAMPVIYLLHLHRTRALVGLILVFFTVNILYHQFATGGALKLIGGTYLPWIGFFLAGVLAQRHFDRIQKFVEGRFLIWMLVYLIAVFIAGYFDLSDFGKRINPLLFVVLCGVILSAAYTRPELSNRLLRHNDLSYGIYIYHWPLINIFVETKVLGPGPAIASVCVLVFVFAGLSWFLVEKPIMRLKRGQRHRKFGSGDLSKKN